MLDRPLEGGNLGYRLLKGLLLKYNIPVDKVKAAAAVHAHNLAVVSVPLTCFNTSFISVFNMLLTVVFSCFFLHQSAQSGKELCDLYRHFQGAYHSELEAYQLTANQLADKKSELEASEAKLVKAKSDLTQSKADLEAANKKAS